MLFVAVGAGNGNGWWYGGGGDDNNSFGRRELVYSQSKLTSVLRFIRFNVMTPALLAVFVVAVAIVRAYFLPLTH